MEAKLPDNCQLSLDSWQLFFLRIPAKRIEPLSGDKEKNLMQVIQQFTTDYFEKIKKEFESDSLFRQNYILVHHVANIVGNEALSRILQNIKIPEAYTSELISCRVLLEKLMSSLEIM